MSEKSPKWKRPSDVMKTHRKKKRLSQSQPLTDEKCISSSKILQDSTNVFFNAKRRNPFSSNSSSDSPSKRRKSENDDRNMDESTNAFFAILDTADKTNGRINNVKVEKATKDGKITKDLLIEDDDERSQFDFIEKFIKASQQHKIKDEPKKNSNQEKEIQTENKADSVPVDWSVKVKLRVVSKSSLLWCTQIKTAEEAQGVTDFVSHCSQGPSSDDKSEFQSCCLYWMYPNLPWLRLFPRIIPDSKIRSSFTGLLNDDIQKALLEDWTESFTSAFHQLRAQQCPYFYLCTHQFSVLFRAAGIAGQSGLNAFLTPTTRGLREALKTEGIEFSMPVLEKKRDLTSSDKLQKENISDINDGVTKDEDDDDEFLDTDEGASVWLESIGLDKKQFPSLDPNKVKIQREGFRVIDNRPESLVFVQGCNVQALFNYLLNCRSCVASSGIQAGVPPTILSPSPFKGASVNSHKIKHSLVKQTETDGSVKHVHILEVSGPILPHHVHRLKSTLERTQEGDFTLTFNTHDPTVPFNAQLEKNSSVIVDRAKFSMKGDNFDTFFNTQDICDRLTCIKELYCSENKYSWAT